MLILTRRIGETLVFDDGAVKIKVLGLKGRHVRLGITAAPEVQVLREEVYERIQRGEEPKPKPKPKPKNKRTLSLPDPKPMRDW